MLGKSLGPYYGGCVYVRMNLGVVLTMDASVFRVVANVGFYWAQFGSAWRSLSHSVID
jgi:hypothetical protein